MLMEKKKKIFKHSESNLTLEC